MKKASVFIAKDYRAYIRDRIKEEESSWGLISKLAEAAGCQSSYLSRALSDKVHLTADQVYGICSYWKLNTRETDFLLTLCESERASSQKYRQRLQDKLKAFRQENENLQTRLEMPKVSLGENENLQTRLERPKVSLGENEVTYYSSWHFAALHIIVSIPKFRTVENIAKHLQIDAGLVKHSLEFLESAGLVRRQGQEWHFNSSEIHVPRNSPLVSLHHSHWRQRAVLDAQKLNQESVHFSGVYSIDARAWEVIKERILRVIEEVAAIASPAKEEKLAAVCFDCFEV